MATLADLVTPATPTKEQIEINSADARFQLDRDRWLRDPQTLDLFNRLLEAQLTLDQAAKDLAELDEQPNAAKIRGLLLKSTTIRKMLDYAKRRNRTDNFDA